MSPGTDEELVFGASVEDKTTEFFDKFDKNVKDVGKKAEEGFKEVSNTIEDAGLKTGIVAGLVSGLTGKLVELALKAVDAFGEFARQAVEVSVQLEAVASGLETVANNAGITDEEISKLVTDMSGMGLSTKDTMNSITKMIQGEIDLKDAVALSKVAIDASAISNMSEAQSMQALTRAIEFRNKRTLQTMGIVVDFTAADKLYAAQLGKDVKNLSDMEKKQSAVNAILKEGINIQGAYEAKLKTTAGARQKFAQDQEAMFEKIGVMFEPSVNEAWQHFVDILEEINKFLDENKGSMEEFGGFVKELTGLSFDALTTSLKTFLELAGGFNKKMDEGYQAWAKMFAQMAGRPPEKFYDFWKQVLTTLDFVLAVTVSWSAEMAVRLAYPFVVLYKAATDIKNAGTILAKALKDLLTGDLEKRFDNFGKNAYDTVLKGLYESQKDFWANPDNIIPDDVVDPAILQAKKLAEALVQATDKMKALKTALSEEASARALSETRKAIEDALKEGWRLEDLARTLTESTTQITKGGEEAKTKVVEDANKNRLKLEEDYHRRLREIMSDFNFEASELARRRDAVGILALTRQTNRTLEKEKQAYKERKAEAEKAYRETIKEIDKSVADQMKKLEEARTKQAEDYQRNLDRQKELQALHDKWQDEDIATQTAKREKELFDSFQALDGMTAAGLDVMRQLWLNYRDDLATIMRQITDIQGAGVGMVGGQGGKIIMGGTVMGQAGQVSQMLTPANMTPSQVGNVPNVVPRSSTSRKEIKVTVDGNALTPYLQRVVVNTLTEIERNRG